MTVYLCHCTDCQTQSGTSFATSMIVRQDAFEIVSGEPERVEVQLEDGRVKKNLVCPVCHVRVGGESSAAGFFVIEPGTLDDTSWVNPIGHIWSRSAQPWFEWREDSVVIEKQPDEEEILNLVRAWKNLGSKH